MSLIISVPDALRMSVEAATGGNVTVLYSATGLPGYYRVVPRFNLDSIDASLGGATPHPAFIKNGATKSEIFIGMYQATVKNGQALSLTGLDPTVNVTFDQALAYCAACGPGFHLMTNAEWSALALWCWKNGTMPRGNTNFGASSDAAWETGRLVAGAGGRTLTGSGPNSWRHDNTPIGIDGLCGNVWGWVSGMRINAGEINVIADNDAADNTKDQSAGSALWRAIDGTTGGLVAPGSSNTVKYATSGTAAQTLVCASGSCFEGMTNAGSVGAAALRLAKSLGIYPVAASGLGGDGFWMDSNGERLPLRGGAWSSGVLGGVFSLYLSGLRSYVDAFFGFRPAFVA